MRLTAATESWPIAGAFTISRGSRTEAVVVVATIQADGLVGRGECVPYPRYGETVEGVEALIRDQADALAGGMTREALATRLPAGAARNALDAALWDLEAKRVGQRAWDIAGRPAPEPAMTCFTLSLGTPETMEAAARAARARPLLKVKLGGAGDPARIAAVRRGAPESRLVVDANEAWDEATIEENLAACAEAGVLLVEQPLPAEADGLLARIAHPIPICADESLHPGASLEPLLGRYDAVNVKLDKAGGLTAALVLAEEARARGLAVMVGCMLGTSLGMAPATLLAGEAAFVDLDGPLLLARDRAPGLRYEGSLVHPPEPALWG